MTRVLQRLLKHFNGTAISTSLFLPSSEALPVILTLNLNDSGSATEALRSSL